MKVGDKTFKVHLDGYDITDALAGKAPSPRKEFFYFNDDGSLVGAALRPVEDRLRRAARARPRRLAGSVRAAALPEALQPALRSLRDGRPRGHGLRALAGRARLRARAGAAVRRRSSWPRSRSSRRARSPAASRSTRCWRTLSRRRGATSERHAVRWHAADATGAARDGRGRWHAIRTLRRVAAVRRPGRRLRPHGARGTRRRSAAVVERRRGQAGHRRLRREGHEDGLAGLRAARRAHRRRSTTTARSGPSSRCTSSSLFALDRVKALAPQHPGVEGQGAVRVAAQGRHEGARSPAARRRCSRSSWPRTPA